METDFERVQIKVKFNVCFSVLVGRTELVLFSS